MSLQALLKAKLLDGLDAMGIELTTLQHDALIQYVLLIDKWNKVHNLTAIREPLNMVTLHLLDSLSVLKYVQASNAKTLLDVGAGAGLPSIPLAICLPDLQVTAIDAVQKKASFMRQVKGELQLDNFQVLAGRVELVKPDQLFDVVISRAFSDIGLFISLTKHLLKLDGLWLAMKGLIPLQELESANVTASQITVLNVAGLDAQRHLINIPRAQLAN
jgi:16S rRNA (guanine527-N7)-methyltransferase